MSETDDAVLAELRAHNRDLLYRARRSPPDAERVVALTVPLLDSSAEATVVGALNCLFTAGPAVAAAIPAVRRQLEHASSLVREASIATLSQIAQSSPNAAVQDLLRIAERPEHLRAAVWWLIHLRRGAAAAAPLLCRVGASGSDAKLRALALRGLRDIGASDEIAVSTWKQALADRSATVRAQASKLLREKGAA
jgi:hypothetical protein